MDYVVVSGASRKNEKWEHKDGETVAVEGPSEAQRLASDPMYRLEHSAQDQEKAKEGAPRIARIIVSQRTGLGYQACQLQLPCTRPCKRRGGMTTPSTNC